MLASRGRSLSAMKPASDIRIISILLVGLGLGSSCLAQVPPDAVAYRQVIQEIAEAQRQMDLAAVNCGASRLRQILGDRAGIPEDAPVVYYQPGDADPPQAGRVRCYWDKVFDSARRSFPWDINPEGDPLRMRTGLRQAGRSIICFTLLAELYPEQREQWASLALEAGEWLIERQLPNGLFPFPDIRQTNAFFGQMIEALLRQLPEALHRGWIVHDGGDGALQYDHAVCGVALVRLHRMTGDPRFLQSGRKAADWALTQPSVPNWNYNAFTVWLLSEVEPLLPGFGYGDAALLKARLGILPGLMENGRWMDPHNAKIVYHAINARGLLALRRSLPGDHPGIGEIHAALQLCLKEAVRDVLENGVTSASVLTEVLSDALYFNLAPDGAEKALTKLIQSGMAAEHGLKVPEPGPYVVNYLRWIESKEK
jgi:hypothetical protein